MGGSEANPKGTNKKQMDKCWVGGGFNLADIMKKDQLKDSTKIVVAALLKFPSLPTMTLAKKIYKENPECFTKLETVRTSIRLQRGVSGNTKQRTRAKLKGQRVLVNERMELPKARQTERQPYILPRSQNKVLIISDLHIPFFDEVALKLALDFGKKNKIDTILLNGDIIDFMSVSRFMTNPKDRDIVSEINDTKQVLKYIRKMFPKALIIFKTGNHELRLEHYMLLKAPELFDLDFWKIEDLFNFAELRIHLVKSLDYVLLGKLKVVHGHEYRGGFIAPVNPARGLFLRTKESALQSHVHRTSEHTEKTIGGTLIGCWSIGCLCELQPDYNPYNNYNLGFAMVEVKKNGAFSVFNKRIIDGVIL